MCRAALATRRFLITLQLLHCDTNRQNEISCYKLDYFFDTCKQNCCLLYFFVISDYFLYSKVENTTFYIYWLWLQILISILHMFMAAQREWMAITHIWEQHKKVDNYRAWIKTNTKRAAIKWKKLMDKTWHVHCCFVRPALLKLNISQWKKYKIGGQNISKCVFHIKKI